MFHVQGSITSGYCCSSVKALPSLLFCPLISSLVTAIVTYIKEEEEKKWDRYSACPRSQADLCVAVALLWLLVLWWFSNREEMWLSSPSPSGITWSWVWAPAILLLNQLLCLVEILGFQIRKLTQITVTQLCCSEILEHIWKKLRDLFSGGWQYHGSRISRSSAWQPCVASSVAPVQQVVVPPTERDGIIRWWHWSDQGAS